MCGECLKEIHGSPFSNQGPERCTWGMRETETGQVGSMDPALSIGDRNGVPEPGLEVENSPLISWGYERSQDGVSQNLVSKRSLIRDIVGACEIQHGVSENPVSKRSTARDIVGARERNRRWCSSAWSRSGRLLIGVVGVRVREV